MSFNSKSKNLTQDQTRTLEIVDRITGLKNLSELNTITTTKILGDIDFKGNQLKFIRELFKIENKARSVTEVKLKERILKWIQEENPNKDSITILYNQIIEALNSSSEKKITISPRFTLDSIIDINKKIEKIKENIDDLDPNSEDKAQLEKEIKILEDKRTAAMFREHKEDKPAGTGPFPEVRRGPFPEVRRGQAAAAGGLVEAGDLPPPPPPPQLPLLSNETIEILEGKTEGKKGKVTHEAIKEKDIKPKENIKPKNTNIKENLNKFIRRSNINVDFSERRRKNILIMSNRYNKTN